MKLRTESPVSWFRCLTHSAPVFLRYGNWTFGGGSSTVAVLQAELMDRCRWIDRETFTLAFGLARLTPGTNLLSFGAGIGWLLRGWGGALSAAVGVMVATGWTLIRPFWAETSLLRSILLVGGAMVLSLGALSPILILLIAACAGLLWPEREPS
jgi:chromate transport protein ChrA